MTSTAASAPDPGMFPLALMLDGKQVTLVGGGAVAARRAAAFAAAGARLHVISPRLDPRLELLLGPDDTWVARRFAPGDLAGAWLVHTATGDVAVDAAVSAEARAARVFCIAAGNAADRKSVV